MVRLCSLSLLALFAGAAFANSNADQQVLSDASVQFTPKWSYDDCGSPSDFIQLKSLTVSPDPPEPGKNLTVTVTGTAIETIEEGAYADVTVKLGLIKLLTKQFDVCEEARAAKTSLQCPVEKGEYTVSHTVALPKEIPQAKFGISIRGFTVNDEDMICLDLKVDFTKFPFFNSW